MKRFFCLFTAIILASVSIPSHSTFANSSESSGELSQDPSTLFYQDRTASQSYTITLEKPQGTTQSEDPDTALSLWLDINPAIFVPYNPARLHWSITNFEMHHPDDLLSLSVLLPEYLSIDGLEGNPFETKQVRYQLPITDDEGFFTLVQNADLEENYISFSIDLIRNDEVIDVQSVIMSVLPQEDTEDTQGSRGQTDLFCLW